MIQRAIVISTPTRTEARVACFLSVLGIESEVLTAAALLRMHGPEILAGGEIQACLIVCGEGLRELGSELNERQIPASAVGRAFGRSLIHSLDQSPNSLRALGGFLSGAKIAARKPSAAPLRYCITDKYPEMCGALSGLSFVSTEMAGDRGLEFESCDGVTETIISTDGASLLTRVRQASREVFVASGAEVLDLREHTSKNVDFRVCFSRIVPFLIALRHLFRGSCWAPETHYANIIIDDPPLWPKYGHLDMRELAALVDRTGCACTIAMIPWNYRRSDPGTVRLVASRQPRFGLCVHGCDHTAAEFGSRDREKLTGKVLTARRRMEAHQQHTGLSCQPVMVFPQGVFSVEAMSCLRPGGYLAAVNTEVADCRGQVRLTLQDLLDPAILSYDGSPLFTRRRPEDGPVNFAVDSFLGKPCLVVLHHDFFQGGIKKLEELVHTFTNFYPRLAWDNLENIVKGCALSKRGADGHRAVRIFATRAVIRADRGRSEELTVVKREADSDKINRVELDDRVAEFSVENGLLKLLLEPPTNRTVSVSIVSAENPAVRVTEDSIGEKARVALRRYLCEFRDNHLAKSETLLRCARSVGKCLQRH
jgi:hypothetical protein